MYLETDIQKKVIALLGWTELQHNEFVANTAIAYLQAFIPAYPQVKRQILSSKVFWQWWCRHWTDRDKTFLEKCEDPMDRDMMEGVYQEDHDGRSLAMGIYLSGQILEESYSVMIGDLTRSQMKEAVC